MIISCPECAGPFEVPDDRIAALVQVACPHCAFRMILDFAAANDPGLVEQGMRMASGFRSAADYHASVQVAAAPVETEAVALEATTDEPAYEASTDEQAAVEPEPEPVRARPEPVAQAEPPARVRPEPVAPAAAPPRSREPARHVSEEARTEVHMLPRGAEKLTPVDIPPVRHRPPPRPDEEDIAVNVPNPATEIVRTVVGPPPTPPSPDEVAIDIDDEDEQETVSDQPPVRTPATPAERAAHPAFGDDEDEDVPTMVVTSETRDAARREMDAALAARRSRPEPEADKTPSGRERPRPPHTPPGRAKPRDGEPEAPPPVTPADKGERPVRRPADETTLPPVEPLDDEEGVPERMSTFGVVMVVLLLLIAGGLLGASIALNEGHSPDPRPLLEKLYRQYVKGEPAAPAKPEAKTEKEPGSAQGPSGTPSSGEGKPTDPPPPVEK